MVSPKLGFFSSGYLPRQWNRRCLSLRCCSSLAMMAGVLPLPEGASCRKNRTMIGFRLIFVPREYVIFLSPFPPGASFLVVLHHVLL